MGQELWYSFKYKRKTLGVGKLQRQIITKKYCLLRIKFAIIVFVILLLLMLKMEIVALL